MPASLSRSISWVFSPALALALLLISSPTPAVAAVTAFVAAHQLIVAGDGAANVITVRVVAGNAARLEVLDSGTVLGSFPRSTFTTILVNAVGGNDTIFVNPVNGPITEPSTLNGGPDNDIIDSGGTGVAHVDGGAGNDRIIWNAGAGNAQIDGGDGFDILEFNGSADSDGVTLRAAGARVVIFRDIGSTFLDVGTAERYFVNGLGGNDTLTGTLGLGALIDLRLNGGDGDDTLTGADGIDELMGGNGNDTLLGRLNQDLLLGGAGDDVFQWFPGDNSDVVEGGDGNDRLEFNGANINETILITQNGDRVRLERDVSSVSIDLHEVETTAIRPLGGVDTVTVGQNLFALTIVDVDLGDGDDTLNTNASSIVIADGGAGTDRVNFNALSQPLTRTDTTIASGAQLRLTHEDFETVSITSSLGTAPTLNITAPTTSSTTRVTTPFVSLAGTATDDVGVTSVTWVNDRGGSGTARGTTAWTIDDIPLRPGRNEIAVAAADSAGNKGVDTLRVTVDALTYTMAEGSTGAFFDTDILLANPNAVAAPVVINYLTGSGDEISQSLTLAPTSRTTIAVDQIPGLEATEVSATVTSTAALPLVVERTMRWDATGYGAHTEKATDGPATTWLFAEGSQGFFDTYVLLANPGSVESTATLTFLLEGATPIVKTFTLAPTSRRTVPVSTIPELLNQSFGIIVNFTQPGVAERAMYFGSPVFNAGHESAGVNAPATEWFLAEGATGSFFTTFVLLANPGSADATATVTFLPEGGLPVMKTKTVPAGRRLTLNIAQEDATLTGGAVATRVVSTQPILVERAQYWPFTFDRWYEAHNSFGSTKVSTKWGLAEGRSGGPEAYQTFILMANADASQAAQVRVTFLRTDGTTVVKTVTVNPASRFTLPVSSVAELTNQSFGALIEVTSGPGIFVERAMYSNANGVVFAAGTNALATRLP
jgi:hypothetical protein